MKITGNIATTLKSNKQDDVQPINSLLNRKNILEHIKNTSAREVVVN